MISLIIRKEKRIDIKCGTDSTSGQKFYDHLLLLLNGFTVHCVEFFNQFYLQILSYLYMYLVQLNMEAVIVFVYSSTVVL